MAKGVTEGLENLALWFGDAAEAVGRAGGAAFDYLAAGGALLVSLARGFSWNRFQDACNWRTEYGSAALLSSATALVLAKFFFAAQLGLFPTEIMERSEPGFRFAAHLAFMYFVFVAGVVVGSSADSGSLSSGQVLVLGIVLLFLAGVGLFKFFQTAKATLQFLDFAGFALLLAMGASTVIVTTLGLLTILGRMREAIDRRGGTAC